MSSLVERAVETYVAIPNERDPAGRIALIDACWAEDGRLVAHGGGTVRGRAAIAAMFERFLADSRVVRVRLVASDARGTTFRFRHATDYADGTVTEGFDAGEIDDEGRIRLLLAFATPL